MKNKPFLMLVLGLPGAGKSTFTKTLKPEMFPMPRLVINVDDIRLAYGHVYKEELEPAVMRYAHSVTVEALCRRQTVIVDECLTSRSEARVFASAATLYGADLVMVEIDADPTECLVRRAATGFPLSAWAMKYDAWVAKRERILSLADVHIKITNPEDMEAYHEFHKERFPALAAH